MAAKETVVDSVKMQDGRIVDFPGKRKLQKESFISNDGTIAIRLDFRNGETRTVSLRQDMLSKYAAHGAEQKLGDEIAGLKDPSGAEASVDDCVLTIDELIDRLNAGEWTVKKEGAKVSGTSILLRAIMEVRQLPAETVKAFLKTKSQAEKLALRDLPKYRDVVKRLEAEKDAKREKIDVAPLEAELDAM